jgi:hypothetical protein
MGDGLASLAINSVYRQEDDLARSACLEALALCVRVDHKVQVGLCLECLAVLAAVQDQPERSLRLAASVAALRDGLGAPATAISRRRQERWLEPAWERLSATDRDQLWQEGFQMSMDEAVQYGYQVAGESPPT